MPIIEGHAVVCNSIELGGFGWSSVFSMTQ